MRPTERVLDEIRALSDRIAQPSARSGGAEATSSVPPGVDPVAYALEEVARLRQVVEHGGFEAEPAERVDSWTPAVGVYAGENTVKILVELPGVAQGDVSVASRGDELVVCGERRPPAEYGDLESVVIEQSWGVFERRFQMPDWCTPETISAHCSNGVLEITLSRGSGSVIEIPVDVR